MRQLHRRIRQVPDLVYLDRIAECRRVMEYHPGLSCRRRQRRHHLHRDLVTLLELRLNLQEHLVHRDRHERPSHRQVTIDPRDPPQVHNLRRPPVDGHAVALRLCRGPRREVRTKLQLKHPVALRHHLPQSQHRKVNRSARHRRNLSRVIHEAPRRVPSGHHLGGCALRHHAVAGPILHAHWQGQGHHRTLKFRERRLRHGLTLQFPAHHRLHRLHEFGIRIRLVPLADHAVRHRILDRPRHAHPHRQFDRLGTQGPGITHPKRCPHGHAVVHQTAEILHRIGRLRTGHHQHQHQHHPFVHFGLPVSGITLRSRHPSQSHPDNTIYFTGKGNGASDHQDGVYDHYTINDAVCLRLH